MSNEKAHALVLAETLMSISNGRLPESESIFAAAATELQTQHFRIKELESMLESVGAGGVSAPAELNLDDYYCKGCGRIGEIEELNAQDKAELRKLDGKPENSSRASGAAWACGSASTWLSLENNA